MPKVLISDSMSNVAQKIFEKNNITVDVKTGLSEEEIIKIIPEYDGMVVRSATKVTKNIIEAAKNLKVIGRAGAGVDNIDVPMAKEKNMIVMNTPGGNANATAEHAFALIMSVLRRVPFANETTHKGQWEKKNIKGTEINLFTPYGPYDYKYRLVQSSVIDLIKGKHPVIKNPNSQRDFIYINDVIEIMEKVIFSNQKIYSFSKY